MSHATIYNQKKFRQQILFEGLPQDPNDKRHGTDIDFEFENGKVWIKAEVKQHGKKITTGQKILFERFARNVKNYKVYCFVIWHNVPADKDIYIKDCFVAAVFWGNKWIDYRAKNKNFKEVFINITK